MSDKIISYQVNLPWSKAFEIAVKSLKKRFARSLITMVSVILAIAFLMSIWVTHHLEMGLKALKIPAINSLLMQNGVDLTSTSQVSSKMIWLISLSLMVCSVGIVNAMLMSVTERFREIGTMKCLGAMDNFIIKLFMIEAGIQGALGTVAGIVLGTAIGFGSGVYAYGQVAVTSVSPLAVAESALLSLAVGVTLCLVFAIYPAYVAASMQPVEAMRVEE